MYYPVIDGDGLLYRCGFAAQHKIYECDGMDFSSKKELETYLKLPRGEPEVITTRIELEPVENAISNVKLVIESIFSTTEALDYTVYISSNTPTFRDRLATIRPYKGNRPADGKPIHYEAMRNYLINIWQAKECFDLEADDMCAIHQTITKDSIIVTNDKDLYQIPGWHYNWTKPEQGCFNISEEEARHWKYIQALCGDATDNIEGIPGLGEQGAKKLLNDYIGSSDEDYDSICSMYYDTVFTDDFKPLKGKGITGAAYAKILGKTPEEIYQENKTLTIIRTSELNIGWENS